MNQEVAPADLPIADKIWKHLPRRIDEKKIEVNFYIKCSEFCIFLLFFFFGFKLHGNKSVNFNLYGWIENMFLLFNWNCFKNYKCVNFPLVKTLW